MLDKEGFFECVGRRGDRGGVRGLLPDGGGEDIFGVSTSVIVRGIELS